MSIPIHKVYRFVGARGLDTKPEERAKAEAAAREKFPDAEWVRAGLYGDSIYVEVHKDKRTDIYGWRS